jgi:hypothetical protein
MFLYDAGRILHRHIPAAEIDHFAAQINVCVIKRCPLEFVGRHIRMSKIWKLTREVWRVKNGRILGMRKERRRQLLASVGTLDEAATISSQNSSDARMSPFSRSSVALSKSVFSDG